MSGRKRTNISPSLFPFLAVLVCTLGTLILLLALVARDATDSAQQQAEAARMKTAEDQSPAFSSNPIEPKPAAERLSADVVDKMIAEEDFRVGELVAFREKQTADLENRRDQVGQVENHIGRLRAELQQLSGEVERAMGETEIEMVDETVLVSYRKKIDDERKAIKELTGNSQSKAPRIVIVPHKGPNGTDRRPIYLECEAEGITIWPEGTRITLQQLEDSDAVANPLDAALRVVRHHAMQTYGDTTPPYPLLVVRPDGIETYGNARNAMAKWDDQFGYELVPGELKLAYSVPDANLKRELEATIAREVAAQSPRMHAAGHGGGSGYGGSGYGGSGYGGSGYGGSGYGGSSRSSGTRPRVLSAASLDRSGRSRGFHTDRGNEDFGSLSRSRSSDRLTGSDAYGSTTGSPGSGTGGYTGGNASSPTDPSGIDPETEKRWAEDMRSAAGEVGGGGFGPKSVDDANFESGGLAGAEWEGSGQSGQDDSGNRSEFSQGSEGQGGEGQNGEAQGDARQGDEFGHAGKLNTPGRSAGSRTAGDTATSSISAGTTGTGGAQSSGSPSQPSAAQASPSQPSGDANSAQSAPQMSVQMRPKRELVKPTGRDWALPREVAGAHGNAIVRTIRVQCYADQLVLLPPARGGATEIFGVADGDVLRATLELATSVHDRVSQWGVAMLGGRWQPRLDVEVMPGGDQRFLQLRSIMEDSGLDVTRRSGQ